MNTLNFTVKRIRGGHIAGLALCLGLSAPLANAEQSLDLSYPPADSPTRIINAQAGEVNTGEPLSPEQIKQHEQDHNRHHFIIDSKFEVSWPNTPTEKMVSSMPTPTALSPAAQSASRAPDKPSKNTGKQSGQTGSH
ncbi:MAG TPA: hypothetical protein ENI80_05895 [Acidiferrobacteraceae bacterium]|nr:hypothetical protein [Acidiferrobacteraceae bacterium]